MEVGQGPNWGCSAKRKKKEDMLVKLAIHPYLMPGLRMVELHDYSEI
jgi:hypothetical protein